MVYVNSISVKINYCTAVEKSRPMYLVLNLDNDTALISVWCTKYDLVLNAVRQNVYVYVHTVLSITICESIGTF